MAIQQQKPQSQIQQEQGRLPTPTPESNSTTSVVGNFNPHITHGDNISTGDDTTPIEAPGMVKQQVVAAPGSEKEDMQHSFQLQMIPRRITPPTSSPSTNEPKNAYQEPVPSSSESSLVSDVGCASTTSTPATTAPSSPARTPLKHFAQSLKIDQQGVIGRGSFCIVRRASSYSDGKAYALKTPSRQGQDAVVMREARMLSELHAESGAKEGIEVFYGLVDELPGLALRLYARTMKSFLKRGPRTVDNLYVGEKRWFQWALQLSRGLEFLQCKNVVHCDIKTDNVFLDAEGNACLGDFSSAKFQDEELDDGDLAAGAFSVQFSAPELLSASNSKPSFATDVYSLGLVLFHAATGSEPYQLATQGISQKLLWAQKGACLMYSSDEDLVRLATVQNVVEKFLITREDICTIIPHLQDMSKTVL